MNAQIRVPLATDTKRFAGAYLVWRVSGHGLRRGLTKPAAAEVKARRARPPRFRHADFSSAEAEAQRLARLCPGTTFLIIQEVARVKVEERTDG